ncbi:hypothetical protein EP7_004915 [Isosphaeraceae bacterium EP7]
MAVCDQGYLCEVCGQEVDDLVDSDLYLRYVLGEVEPDLLHKVAERHLRCNPSRAQFIVAEGFEPVAVEGPFDKAELDPEFVSAEETRVTRGYLRLCELMGQEGVSLLDYPLPEVRERWRAAAQGEAPR